MVSQTFARFAGLLSVLIKNCPSALLAVKQLIRTIEIESLSECDSFKGQETQYGRENRKKRHMIVSELLWM